MKRYARGPIDIRLLDSPRLYLRLGRLVVMWWPREPWRRRLELRWEGAD